MDAIADAYTFSEGMLNPTDLSMEPAVAFDSFLRGGHSVLPKTEDEPVPVDEVFSEEEGAGVDQLKMEGGG